MLHHPHKTIAALAGSLLLSLALGCQTPMATNVPKVAVSLGSLQWSSEADLAILLDFRPLLNMRKLQAVPTGGGTDVGPVASVEAKVTGDNIVGEITAPVIQTSMCPGGVATINFSHLPAGHVKVVVNAYDAAHHLITYGTGETEIVAGEVKTVNVTCQAADSGLNVIFNCPNCGDPVPPVAPANPTAAGLTNWVQGLVVDPSGNIYLVSTDPGVNPNLPMPANAGRVIKVPADLSNNGALFGDTDQLHGSSYEGVIHNGNLLVGIKQDFTTPEYDLTTGSEKLSFAHSYAMAPATYTVDSQNNAIGGFQGNPYNWFGIKRLSPETHLYIENQQTFFDFKGPYCLLMDEQDHPLFTGLNKIYTVPNPIANPQNLTPPRYNNQVVLATLPASFPSDARFYGFEKADTASRFLLSVTGTSDIYLWDRNDPTNFGAKAATLAGEFPHQIEHAGNGKYYVLTTKTDTINHAIDQYRVYKFDLVDGQLTNKVLMVTSY